MKRLFLLLLLTVAGATISFAQGKKEKKSAFIFNSFIIYSFLLLKAEQ